MMPQHKRKRSSICFLEILSCVATRLIEKFIEENLPHISDIDAIQDEFERFWHEEKIMALSKMCEEEHLDKKQFKA